MTKAGQMVKHSTIYALGNILRKLVGFIMLPIYTNYLTPGDYGTVGLLVFMVSLIEAVFGAHMISAVPKFYHEGKTKKEKNCVVSTAFLVTTIFSGASALLMITFSDQLSAVLLGDVKHSIYRIILFHIGADQCTGGVRVNLLENTQATLAFLCIQHRKIISATKFKHSFHRSLGNGRDGCGTFLIYLFDNDCTYINH